MSPLYSVEEIRQIEQAAYATLPAGILMQRAGEAAAQLALALIGSGSGGSCPTGSGTAHKVLVLAGPGNNGGDALEAAYLLDRAGLDVTIALYANPPAQSRDAQQAWQRAKGGTARFADPDAVAGFEGQAWTLVIDGLFGIGLARPIIGPMHAAVKFINSLCCPILALDVPSGLNADTGTIIGPGGIAVRASHTLSFITDKPGLHTGHGRDCAGQIQVAMLGISPTLFPSAHTHLNDPQLFAGTIHRRPHDSHKGSFGDVAVLGGAEGMQGAPLLAARAALKCGAGRVYVAFIDAAPAYDGTQPELMCRRADGFDFSNAIVVAGPGAGMSDKASALLDRVIDCDLPVVLDADALNLVADEPGLQHKLARRQAATLLTPHPLEAARLLGLSAAEIQANRLAAARKLAGQFNAIVILKGSGTVIASPDGAAVINPTGNPALATAGTGDVLAGVCGALLAQQLPPWQAALAAVWLHGHAADLLVTQGIGPIGLTAGELIPAIRSALNLLAGSPPASTSIA